MQTRSSKRSIQACGSSVTHLPNSHKSALARLNPDLKSLVEDKDFSKAASLASAQSGLREESQ